MENRKTIGPRLGVLVSHPIQYYSPWFRDLASRLDLTVYYAHRQDSRGQSKAGFGIEFDWDVPLLDGYSSQWLRNVSRQPGLGSFFGCDTPEIGEIINRERFSAFLIIGWNKKSYWQAIRACWKHKTPVFMRGDSQLPQTTSRVKRLIKELPYRWFLPKIDRHFYVGERNREYLTYYGVTESRLAESRHFVDNAYFASNAERAYLAGNCEELREQLGIGRTSLVALFVGKFIPKKRPLDFVRAIHNASKSVDVHGIVVGSGPMEDECRLLAADSDRLHFLGFKNQSQLPLIYRTADLLVLPSDGTETWGLVANEALATGTPCLLSDGCGCSADFASSRTICKSFPTGNVQEIVDAIILIGSSRAYMSPDWRVKARNVINRYSVQAASESLVRVVSEYC